MARHQTVEYAATGRRKTSVARVRIALGVGKREINGMSLEDYFGTSSLVGFVEQPLKAVDAVKRYDVIAQLKGGGKIGQAGALRHGIARALVESDESLRQPLKEGGFLTRDSRMKERKKPGQPGARKRFQFSKR